ncbi:uncharacterized protein LOC119725335 [Patiria miniata]|uniref:Adenylate kinase n=1 Tax=Patiria miniata TaxID=46514 RepID=A0A913ZLK1_PATMI|nr:uncharacterized protein LOC119725335 [Patiria miniata]
MGCGNSSETEGRKEEEHGFFHRRPKVSIRVGQHVEETSKDETLVVFVFGGPGSKKGRIVDDLVHMYGFRALIAEDLILKELPKKVQNVMTIESTRGLAEMLKDNQSLLSLEWILELIGNEIEKDPKRPHIIDIMPNLRFLLRCEKYIQDPEYDMKNFEKRFHNVFALNLAIPEEKVIKQITAHSAKHPDKMKEAGQSDEADTSRTQRRNALYTSSVKNFLNYFTSSGRLVTVDVACGVADLIWHRVSDFFGHQLELEPIRTVNTVIIFAFDELDFDGLDMDRYALQSVTLKNLVDDSKAPPDKVLAALCRHIDTSAPLVEAFAVDAADTTLLSYTSDRKSRSTRFVEHAETYLDKYIFISNLKKTRGRKCSLFQRLYKVVATTQNEVCLFPQETDTELCKRIALYMAEERKGY